MEQTITNTKYVQPGTIRYAYHIPTGDTIQVYKLIVDGWASYKDKATVYKEEDLRFTNQK